MDRIIKKIFCKRCGGTFFFSEYTCGHVPIYGDGTLDEKNDLVSREELIKLGIKPPPDKY